MPSGWPSIGRLERGVLHEFCGVGGGAGGQDWTPPLALLVHLAAAALGEFDPNGSSASDDMARSRGWSAVWIGSRMWPYPAVLTGHGLAIERDGCCFWTDGDGAFENGAFENDAFENGAFEGRELEHGANGRGDGGRGDGDKPRPELLERSLFVDPGSRALAWTADRALRCPSAAVVVVDGRTLDLGATRRLQLAAEAGETLALIARPAADARRSSVAANRWSVERIAPQAGDPFDGRPAWRIETLKRRTSHWPILDRTVHDETVHDGTVHDETVHDGTVHDETVHHEEADHHTPNCSRHAAEPSAVRRSSDGDQTAADRPVTGDAPQ